MEIHELADIVKAEMKEVKENQANHSRETDLRLRSIEQTCTVLVTQQKTDRDDIKTLKNDVETNKKTLWQIGGVITFLSTTGMAIAQKFFSGGGQ